MVGEDVGGRAAHRIMLLEQARQILGAWRERLVSDQSVVNRADKEIQSTPPAELPEWLLDLSIRGPARCMAGPSSEFIEVPFLPFLEHFALRAQAQRGTVKATTCRGS
jgi:hypothetical protein